MPNMSSGPFLDAVTETVLFGQTCNSPPREMCKTAVSVLAVTDDPDPMRLPTITAEPAPLEETGTTAGFAAVENVEMVAGWASGGGAAAFAAAGSSGGLRRIVRRLPAA